MNEKKPFSWKYPSQQTNEEREFKLKASEKRQLDKNNKWTRRDQKALEFRRWSDVHRE